MRVIRFVELVEMPWKNGGGVTREIASTYCSGKLVWRISMADVAVDGPFSDFGGLMRILTVIEGGAMELVTPEGVLMAQPRVPIRFDGGLPVDARLTSGPLRDLNLMFDPSRVEGNVDCIHGQREMSLDSHGKRIFALHALAGMVGVGPEMLGPGDTAVIEAGSMPVRLGEASSALLISIG